MEKKKKVSIGIEKRERMRKLIKLSPLEFLHKIIIFKK